MHETRHRGGSVQQEMVGHGEGTNDRRSAERLFHRDLPGGGYVAIEVGQSAEADVRQVRVIVERRSDRTRRQGHRPPVILEEAWRSDRGFGDLYRIACDNVAIARGLLKLSRDD